jgi:hypothetical protein
MLLYPVELIREILPPVQTRRLSRSSSFRTFGKFAREGPGTFPAKGIAGFRRRLQNAERGQ